MHLDKVRNLIGQPEGIRLEYKYTLPSAIRIISLIANKKVGDLPKGNSNGFGKYIKRITKIDLFSEIEKSRADLIFETRNLFTHSNGDILNFSVQF